MARSPSFQNRQAAMFGAKAAENPEIIFEAIIILPFKESRRLLSKVVNRRWMSFLGVGHGRLLRIGCGAWRWQQSGDLVF